LVDPDSYLRNKVPEFVMRGDFGLASGPQSGGGYSHIWFRQMLPPEEITFDSEVFLLTSAAARRLTTPADATTANREDAGGEPTNDRSDEAAGPIFGGTTDKPQSMATTTVPIFHTIRMSGDIPTEVWTRLGRSLIPKLKSGGGSLRLGLNVELKIEADSAAALRAELRQIISDLGLDGQLKVE
jgi:hypothetical protein